MGSAEGLLSQPDITGTVFDQEDINGRAIHSHGFHELPPLLAAANSRAQDISSQFLGKKNNIVGFIFMS